MTPSLQEPLLSKEWTDESMDEEHVVLESKYPASVPPPFRPQDNIIVSGIPRTGTTVLTRSLCVPKYEVYKNPKYNSQKWFENDGECEFTVNGINGDRTALYEHMDHKVIKIIGQGLGWTDTRHFPSFRTILMMHRPWRDHEHSIRYIQAKLFSEIHSDMKIQAPLDEFMRDITQPAGIAFGMGYTKLITDAYNRGYIEKIVPIAFDQLLGDPDAVAKELEILLGCAIRINHREILSRPCKGDMPELREFKPGFFSYLDLLQQALLTGNFKHVLNLFNTWGPVMSAAIKEQQKYVREKYKIDTRLTREA